MSLIYFREFGERDQKLKRSEKNALWKAHGACNIIIASAENMR